MDEHDKGFVAGYLAAIQNGIAHNYLDTYRAANLIHETRIPREEWEEAQADTDFMNEEIESALDTAF